MMNCKKTVALALSLALAGSMLASCSQGAENSTSAQEPSAASSAAQVNTDPYYKYPEKIELTAGVQVYDAAKRLPQGDTLEDNRYTRYFEEKTNVHITNAFEAQTGDAYRQKVKLAAASDELPDIMFIHKDDYSLLKQLVEFGQIADLTEAFNTYLDPDVREKLTSGDGSAMAQVTFDGKIMAIPEPTLQYDMTRLLWVRQDWLDKLGLEAPRTVEDFIAVAKAFMEEDPDGNGKKDTYGMVASRNYHTAFEPIFSAYGAYPRLWYRDDSGEVVYGGVQPEAKEALAVLREMYEAGIIDSEFASREGENEQVASNRAGLYFCPWWGPWGNLVDSVTNDRTADWQAYALPLNAEGKFEAPNAAPANCYMVVSSKCENIDAVMRYFNVATNQNDLLEQNLYKDMEGLGEAYRLSAITLVTDYVDCIPKKNVLYNAILAGDEVIGGPTDINPVETEFNINAINEDAKAPKENIENWGQMAAYMIGAKPLVDNPAIQMKEGAFYGVTKTMEGKWANLQQLQDETYLGIIAGTIPLDEFDAFVERWNAQGGSEITEEVRASVQ